MNQLKSCYIAYIMLGVLGVLTLVTQEYWLIIPAVLVLVYLRVNEPKEKEELGKLNDFSSKVFAGAFSAIIIIVILSLITLAILTIIRNHI